MPDPYDVQVGIRETRAGMRRGDPVTATCLHIAGHLADGMAGQYPPAQHQLVGEVLVTLAASVGVLLTEPKEIAVCNITAFAGVMLIDGAA